MLIKEDFSVSDIFVFFHPSPRFNVVAAAKSIGQSNILNIEKGEGGISRMQCNFIGNEEMSLLTILHRIVDTCSTYVCLRVTGPLLKCICVSLSVNF